MAATPAPPVWINLEYLSAEAWIESVHGLPSPHPRLPLTRWFFFPGFTRATGGLLRERDLCARRDAFEQTAREPARLVVSLFCYPTPALPSLLDAWSRGSPMLCRVPQGVATSALRAWLGDDPPPPGAACTRGALTIAGERFGTQDDYDRLLWTSDFNFVRGEDSFVRAQWAARPLAWHAYPQAEGAHLVKVDAFVDRYVASAPPATAAAIRQFMQAWNRGDGAASAAAWHLLRDDLDAQRLHAHDWARQLATLPDLASSLLEFCRNRL